MPNSEASSRSVPRPGLNAARQRRLAGRRRPCSSSRHSCVAAKYEGTASNAAIARSKRRCGRSRAPRREARAPRARGTAGSTRRTRRSRLRPAGRAAGRMNRAQDHAGQAKASERNSGTWASSQAPQGRRSGLDGRCVAGLGPPARLHRRTPVRSSPWSPSNCRIDIVPAVERERQGQCGSTLPNDDRARASRSHPDVLQQPVRSWPGRRCPRCGHVEESRARREQPERVPLRVVRLPRAVSSARAVPAWLAQRVTRRPLSPRAATGLPHRGSRSRRPEGGVELAVLRGRPVQATSAPTTRSATSRLQSVPKRKASANTDCA